MTEFDKRFNAAVGDENWTDAAMAYHDLAEYAAALLAARQERDALRDAAKLVGQIGAQIINNADVYSNTDFLVRRNYVDALGAALNGLAAALAATPEGIAGVRQIRHTEESHDDSTWRVSRA